MTNNLILAISFGFKLNSNLNQSFFVWFRNIKKNYWKHTFRQSLFLRQSECEHSQISKYSFSPWNLGFEGYEFFA